MVSGPGLGPSRNLMWCHSLYFAATYPLCYRHSRARGNSVTPTGCADAETMDPRFRGGDEHGRFGKTHFAGRLRISGLFTKARPFWKAPFPRIPWFSLCLCVIHWHPPEKGRPARSEHAGQRLGGLAELMLTRNASEEVNVSCFCFPCFNPTVFSGAPFSGFAPLIAAKRGEFRLPHRRSETPWRHRG